MVEPASEEDIRAHWIASLEELCRNSKNPQVQAAISERLMQEHVFQTVYEFDDIYVYENGCYHNGGEAIVKRRTQEFLVSARNRDRVSNHITAEVLGHIKRSTMCHLGEFDADPHLLCLKNGILDMQTMVITPHDPSKKFFVQIPVSYVPEAKCPKIEKFFSEIVYEADLKSLYEIVGMCLWKHPDFQFQRAIMLHGGGCNGKSTFISLLKSFLGTRNVSARTLQELENNRFAVANLKGKLANVFADLPSKSLQNVAMFKSLTGGDYLTVEGKYAKHPTEFVNTAKLIFSANTLPETFEETDAFFRRWHIITFPNSFEGKENRNLMMEITTDTELSGLLLKAIAALKEILASGRLSNTLSAQEMRMTYIRRSSPTAYFIQELVVEDSAASTMKEVVYGRFIAFCDEHKLTKVEDNEFFKRLRMHMGSKIREERKTLEGTKTTRRHFVGIRLAEEEASEQLENMRKQVNIGV